MISKDLEETVHQDPEETLLMHTVRQSFHGLSYSIIQSREVDEGSNQK